MDFDTIFSLFFLIVFFVLPSLFKQLKRLGRKSEKKNKETWLTRIRDRITTALQELEQQSREPEADTLSEEDIWQILAQEEGREGDPAEAAPDAQPARHSEVFRGDEDAHAVPETSVKPPLETMPETLTAFQQTKITRRFRSHPLQNAVVWSEILGKPVALK